MRLAEVARVGVITGAAALALVGILATRAPSNEMLPPQVEATKGEPLELSVKVQETAVDSCAGDVRTEGARVYVHLPEDPKTCAGVTRVYRVEGERLIFEQELIDI